MRKFVLLAVLCLMVTGRVHAGPLQLAGDINAGTLFCAADNNVVCANGVQLLDLDPAIGTLDLGTVLIGGLTIEGSLHEDTFGGPLNILNSSSLTITNNTGSAITAQTTVSANNFPGVTSTISNSGSGTWQGAEGSLATYSYYVDATNTEGGQSALDRPGLLLSQFTDTAVGLVDSFAENGGPFPQVIPGPFSMTFGFDLTLVGGGKLISRGQTQVTDVREVPEPVTLSLLGVGLVGVARKLRRRAVA